MTPESPWDLDAVADDLYGRDPAEFITRRTELAREAGSAGNRELSQQISRMRRPTLVAWSLNQWVRADPDGFDALRELGAELREAHRRSSADRLGALALRRQEVLTEALAGVERCASSRHVKLSASIEREAVQTLRAALADDGAAELLRRGRLVTAIEYSGFGPSAIFAVPDLPDSSGESSDGADDLAGAESGGADSADADLADEQARRRVADLLAEATEVHSRAQQVAHKSDRACVAADKVVATLSAEVERMRKALAQRDSELGFARRRQSAAADEAQRAAAEYAQAQAELERAVDAAREFGISNGSIDRS